MKSYFISFIGMFALSFSVSLMAQQVGINTLNPDESAYLDVSGADKGLLLPRLSADNRETLDEKGSIYGPATGLVIYNTDENAMQVNSGDKLNPHWTTLGKGSVGPTPIPATKEKWIYFPVTPLNMEQDPDAPNAFKSLDLYQVYQEQLETNLKLTYTRDQLTFVVLGYDAESFTGPVLISNDLLIYKPKSGAVSEASYLNIAIKIEQ